MLQLLAMLLVVFSVRCGAAQGPPGGPASKQRTAPARGAAAEKALRQIEQDWLTALDKRNAAAVDAILAPDFRDLGVDGLVHTRPQVLALVTDPTRPPLQRSIGRLEIRVYGAQFAVATGLTLVSGEKIREAHIAFTHVYVLRAGKWQVVSSQETLSSE